MVSVRSALAAAGLVFVLSLAGYGSSGAKTKPSLSASLVLTTRTVRAGGELSGHITVENITGHSLRTVGCGSVFQVLLTSKTYKPTLIVPACFRVFTITRGRSSYSVTVRASYNRCLQSGPIGTISSCTPTGTSPLPPLPPGEYEATTFEWGNAVPLPAPVPVRVTG